MRIISSFKDYYDVVGAYDRDPEPVYVRQSIDHKFNQPLSTEAQENIDRARALNGLFFPKQTMIKEDRFERNPTVLPESYTLGGEDGPLSYHTKRQSIGYISFCGRVYPFYILDGPDGEIHCYNIDQYINAINKINPTNRKKILESIETGEYEVRFKRGGGYGKHVKRDYLSRATWAKFTTEYNNKVRVDHYRYLKCPVALRRYGVINQPLRNEDLITLNPRLNQYTFQSQVDPFTAYQELSMYLGNELVDTSNMTPQPITDVMRAETKGFNEWSFRRHKTEDAKYKKKHKE